MNIIITVQEAIDKHIWPQVSLITGYDILAVSEGLSRDIELKLTPEQAEYLGLIIVLGI